MTTTSPLGLALAEISIELLSQIDASPRAQQRALLRSLAVQTIIFSLLPSVRPEMAQSIRNTCFLALEFTEL